MSRRHYWVVSYDIPDDKRRRQVCKIMEGFGRRAQYSVFECELTEEQIARLLFLLRRVVALDEDDVRLYPLNRADLNRVVVIGRARLHRHQATVYVEREPLNPLPPPLSRADDPF